MTDLDDELVQFRTLAFLARRAKERALAAPSDSYVSDLGIPALGKRGTDRRAALEEYFDSIEESLFDQYLLRLVAVFERLVFHKLNAAVGTARTTLEDNYPAASPFSRSKTFGEGHQG